MSNFLRNKWILDTILYSTLICDSSLKDNKIITSNSNNSGNKKKSLRNYGKIKIDNDNSVIITYSLSSFSFAGQILQFLFIPGVVANIDFNKQLYTAYSVDQDDYSPFKSNYSNAYLFFSDKWHYCEALMTPSCLISLKEQIHDRSMNLLDGSLITIQKGALLLQIGLSGSKRSEKYNTSSSSLYNKCPFSPLYSSDDFKEYVCFKVVLILDEIQWIGGDGSPPHGEPQGLFDTYQILNKFKNEKSDIWEIILSSNCCSRINGLEEIIETPNNTMTQPHTMQIAFPPDKIMRKHLLNFNPTESNVPPTCPPSDSIFAPSCNFQVYNNARSIIQSIKSPYLEESVYSPIHLGPFSSINRLRHILEIPSSLDMEQQHFYTSQIYSFPDLNIFMEDTVAKTMAKDSISTTVFLIEDEDCQVTESQSVIFGLLPGWKSILSDGQMEIATSAESETFQDFSFYNSDSINLVEHSDNDVILKMSSRLMDENLMSYSQFGTHSKLYELDQKTSSLKNSRRSKFSGNFIFNTVQPVAPSSVKRQSKTNFLRSVLLGRYLRYLLNEIKNTRY